MFSFIRWQDVADIVIMSFLAYQLYAWFKNTKAFQVVLGLGSLGVLYLITKNLGFFMTSWILQELGTALFVLIIVIFQSEIRQALYRFSPLRNLFGRQENNQRLDLMDLCHTIFSLAKEKTGAIIVFQRKEPLDEYLLHGVMLDSMVSGQLLESIFQDGTPLHDGAVVIRQGRITQASAHLPLSTNSELPQYYGTRHRASLGLTERSDAVVIVVSEERGEVSLALGGTLRKIDSPEHLSNELNGILFSPVQAMSTPSLWKRLHRNILPKAVTVVLVFATWLIITAREGQITNLIVPVTYRNLPDSYLLASSSPDEVEVQLKSFSSLIPPPKEGDVQVNLDLARIKEGSNNIPVKKENFQLPSGVMVSSIKPGAVHVVVDKKARKLLRVKANVTGRPAGRQRLRKIRVEPSLVMVEGPERILSPLEWVKTEEIELSGIRQNAVIEKKIVPPATQVKTIGDTAVKVRIILSRR